MENSMIMLSIDFKKARIRIYKETLRAIGNPQYIQLLISVKKPQVAIKGYDSQYEGENLYKVSKSWTSPDLSFEIYSSILMEKLKKSFDYFTETCTYNLSGIVFPNDRAVIFPISMLSKVNS